MQEKTFYLYKHFNGTLSVALKNTTLVHTIMLTISMQVKPSLHSLAGLVALLEYSASGISMCVRCLLHAVVPPTWLLCHKHVPSELQGHTTNAAASGNNSRQQGGIGSLLANKTANHSDGPIRV